MVYGHSDTENCQGQKWNKTDIQKEFLCLFSANTITGAEGLERKGKKVNLAIPGTVNLGT